MVANTSAVGRLVADLTVSQPTTNTDTWYQKKCQGPIGLFNNFNLSNNINIGQWLLLSHAVLCQSRCLPLFILLSNMK